MTERPNLVLFMPDQLRADALGCFGNPAASTPNYDALAARGTTFSQAYSQHSVCSPSRVSMFTGWYPHVAGHRTLTNLIKPWEPDLLQLLHDAGYFVAWAGARGDTYAPGVIDERTDFTGWLVSPEHLHDAIDVSSDDRRHHAFWLGRRGGDDAVVDLDEATLRTAERLLADGLPEPFVLMVALVFPHPPFVVEEPWYSMHERTAMAPPIAASAARGKPAFQAALRDAYRLDRLDADDWAEIAATYAGMVSRVDDQLGRLVRSLDAAGVADRTAKFCFTDHGEYLGDFGLVEKWPSGLDDCLVRNPLLVSVPGGAEGATCDAVVELVDLLPTICELAATEPTHTHYGRSLVPLLTGGAAAADHRPFACSEGGFSPREHDLLEVADGIYGPKADLQHARPELVGRAYALRTPTHTYVHRVEEGDELYDRRTDPRETTNLVDDPTHATVVAELRAQLLDWLADTADAIPWTPDPRFPRFPNGYRDR
jgi:arylsulfatase A-like enzyme